MNQASEINESKRIKVPKRIASGIINALKGGVVPRVGLGYIAVGRTNEINALLHDVSIAEEGGAFFRFIMGRYGSGKSFLLQTMRQHVMDRGFAACDADLSPERRLMGTNGQGLATYRELMRSLSVKAKPDGGALSLILEKWIDGIRGEVLADGMTRDNMFFDVEVEKRIYAKINSLQDMVHGFDFAAVITAYYHGFRDGNETLQTNAVRWLRGEYSTRTQAKQDLGVNVIISDENWYDYIKLITAFLVSAGYKGMVVMIDELVNIMKISNSVTRHNNYEKILMMYNDVMQGKASHIGIIMGGTPQCIEDTRRGVFSYDALRSRLERGRFATDETHDMLAPIIRLNPLTYEELTVLTEKLSDIHSQLYDYESKVTLEDRIFFVKAEFERIGAQTNITPREMIRDYIELLNIMYQNPDKTLPQLMGSEDFSFTQSESAGEGDGADGFADFEL
ncbi:MAG: ATP-binding protein [Oscillospiraceae bacterium]